MDCGSDASCIDDCNAEAEITMKLTVLGGGESGIGAARLAQSKGYKVLLSDNGEIKEKYKNVLSNHGIEFEEGGHTLDRIFDSEVVVKSPGIPDTIPLIHSLEEKGIYPISEIEFAYKHCSGKIIAITGSNGKTTTTMLTYHMLESAGLDVRMAGNVGSSFAGQLTDGDHDYWVLELSSFQLDGIVDFKPHIAVLLNITPDHLDRYDYKFENYVASKFRIAMNQDENNHFIYWADDQVISEELYKHDLKAQLLPFGIGKKPEGEDWVGAWNEEERLHIKTNNNYFDMSIHDLALQGRHNVFNSMASSLNGRVLDLRKEVVRESLSNFENAEHRLEHVARVAGISFVNDSKATNINSTWYALESIDGPVIWIAGGVDKGNDYSELYDLVDGRVRALICLGTDNKKLHEAFEGRIDSIVDVLSADEAVRVAYDLGYKNDTVLLSPACASFDLFENYEERGHAFKAAVKRL